MSGRGARWIPVGAFAAVASYFVLFRLAETGSGRLAHDIYAHFYPNMLYAVRSIRDGGQGVFWNPLQNCGQPFFGISSTGLLYPPYVLFLVLEADHALRTLRTELAPGRSQG